MLSFFRLVAIVQPLFWQRQFLREHQLSAEFFQLVVPHYDELFNRLQRRVDAYLATQRTFFLGVNGAQGTGKSTLAAYLRAAWQAVEVSAVVISIDDFYLTKSERAQLAMSVHPLFATRGVPGTHRIDWLCETLEQLAHPATSYPLTLPQFDKSSDERAAPQEWQVVPTAPSVVILEGWCVGCPAQQPTALGEPLNELERLEDAQGVWRAHANHQLATGYQQAFSRLDALVMLAAPSYGAVYRWRKEQEAKLATRREGAGLMSDSQLARFVQFFERLTRHSLAQLQDSADAVLRLNEAHRIQQAHYRL